MPRSAHALRAGYHLATARLFVVDDYFFPIYVVRPRAGTTVVQTWHASGAFKQFGYSVLDKSFGADEASTDRVAIHSHYDLCLVSSASAAPHYAEAFGQPLERFVSRLGIPRTDVLVRRAAHRPDRRGPARALRDPSRSARGPLRPDVPRRQRRRGPLRRRPGPARAARRARRRSRGPGPTPSVRPARLRRSSRSSAGFAIDVSDHPDINELLLVSDLLVTDYSSVIYEFSLLGRPMVFFAPDLDAYEGERGFYFDYRTGVPGPVFETTDDVARYLRAGVFDTAGVEAFGRASFDVADGGATRRFVEEIALPALRRRA